MKVRAATHVKFRVLSFRMKIQGLALIGYAMHAKVLLNALF
jgi:hypothetical protein